MSWRHNFLIHIFAHSSRQTIGPRDRSMWLITKKNEFWKKSLGRTPKRGHNFPKFSLPKQSPSTLGWYAKKKFQKNEFLHRDPDTLFTTGCPTQQCTLENIEWSSDPDVCYEVSHTTIFNNQSHCSIPRITSSTTNQNGEKRRQMETADGDVRFRRHMKTAHDVIDGFWETVLERIGNSRTRVAKGYDTQVSKLFKFFKLGCLRKNKFFT